MDQLYLVNAAMARLSTTAALEIAEGGYLMALTAFGVAKAGGDQNAIAAAAQALAAASVALDNAQSADDAAKSAFLAARSAYLAAGGGQ